MFSTSPADMALRLGEPAPPITSSPGLNPEAKPDLGTPCALPAPSTCTGRITGVAGVWEDPEPQTAQSVCAHSE